LFSPAFAAVTRDFFLSINVLIMISPYSFNSPFIPSPSASPIRKQLSALPDGSYDQSRVLLPLHQVKRGEGSAHRRSI
jgi:hypothetical protein